MSPGSQARRLLTLTKIAPLPALGAGLIGFVYITGYLVHSIYVQNRGIPRVDLLRAQYIEGGLTFVALTAFLVGVPFLATSLTLAARRRAGVPRATPFVWVSPAINTNYLYAVIFFAVFITRSDWDHIATGIPGSPSVSEIATIYFAVQFVLLLLTPALRHLRVENRRPKIDSEIDRSLDSPAYRRSVNVLRTLSVLVTLSFDIALYKSLPWLPGFSARAAYYILCIIIVSVAVAVLVSWLRSYTNGTLTAKLAFLGMPFLLSLYLITITTYTYALYRNIPTSRGGRYPVATARIVMERNDLLASGLPHEEAGDLLVTTPLYIVEESDDFIYVLDRPAQDWFGELGPVTGVRRDQLLAIRLTPIQEGGPRWPPSGSRSSRPQN